MCVIGFGGVILGVREVRLGRVIKCDVIVVLLSL